MQKYFYQERADPITPIGWNIIEGDTMESAILGALGPRLSHPTQTFLVAVREGAADEPTAYRITISYTRTVAIEKENV